MKNSMRHIGQRIISVILVLSSLISLLSVACFAQADSSTAEIDTESLSQLIIENLQDDTETDSTEWEDYVGDLDTFVYGLLVQEYEQSYEVFNAAAELSDGTKVYGIGFTDYGSYIETVDGKGYFPAGFISLIGEQGIPDEEADAGLEIINTDSLSEDFGFVLAYDVEPYLEHCVIWGQYLQYGVDENGIITYSTLDYERGVFDEDLGALYSYDESRYLYNPDIGEYYNTSGTSLYEEIDYEELQAQINEILKEQEQNFAVSEVETIIYSSQEAMISYLLSLQDETFMGCDVDELISIAEDLDPMETVRITPDGVFISDMENDPPAEPTALVKWMTGCVCGIILLGTVALDIFVPELMPVWSAIQGACIEVFMEVVVQNKTLEDVNWALVGVAAVSAVLLSWGASTIAAGAAGAAAEAFNSATVGIVVGKVVEVTSIALISGATSSAYTLIEDGDAQDAVNAFIIGAIVGATLSIAVELIGWGLKAIGDALPHVNPNNWINDLTTKAETVAKWISEHQVKIESFSENLDDILIPKSVYQAAEEAVLRYQCGDAQLARRIAQLPADGNSNFIKVDDAGNELTKSEVAKRAGNCTIELREDCDSRIRQIFEENDITTIEVTNGEPQFPEIYKFKPKNEPAGNRNQNMTNYFSELANKWKGNKDKIPPEILDRLNLTDEQVNNLTAKVLREAFSKAEITLHESIDGYVYAVDTYLHSHLSHGGAVALAKAMESIEIAKTYFSELITAHPIEVFGTLIAAEGST